MADWCLWCTSILVFTMVTHKVSCGKVTMDLAPNAVDDTYSECRDKMWDKVILDEDGILQNELSNIDNTMFKNAWNTTACEDQVPGGNPEHVKAFQVFGNNHKLAKVFNAAVKDKGGDVSVYTDQFQFKSLHFLLMDAMRLLNNGSKCQTVYVGSYDTYIAQKDSKVRFGRFLSASKKKSFAEEGCADAGGTLFEIQTCSVVDVKSHACSPENTVMLISPVESFTVEKVGQGEECDNEIKLSSTGIHPNHDCYLFPTTPTTTTSAPATTTTSKSKPTPRGTVSTTAASATGGAARWVDPHWLLLLTTVSHFCFLLSQ